MRPIWDMDAVQVEITNACVLRCANCTRFVGHKKPYFMELEFFYRAIDSMQGFPKIVGIMGGEPTLHPDFEQMCDYALRVLGKQHLGLWTVLPEGKERYRNVICRTFDQIFVNDHSRPDIYHAPLLVSADEVFPRPEDKAEMWRLIDRCWVQNSWSASINPKGAFFCEVAAALAILFDGPDGWPVEPGWWQRMPWSYREQIDWACRQCGAAMPLGRRSSQDEHDDVSPNNLQQLQLIGSKKVARNDFVVSDCKTKPPQTLERMAAYKDTTWRQQVADRWGLYLEVTPDRFWRPHLVEAWRPGAVVEKRSLLQQIIDQRGTRL